MSGAARAAEPGLMTPDQGWLHLHGYVENQLRALGDNFHPNRGYLSQGALVLTLEPEAELVTDGWGPFDLVSAFARLETRYDCVFDGCGTIGATRVFGDHAKASPARNWADGPTLTYAGGIDLREVGIPGTRVQSTLHLLPITANPAFQLGYDAGVDPATVAAAFGPTAKDLFTWKNVQGPRSGIAIPLGPWEYGTKI